MKPRPRYYHTKFAFPKLEPGAEKTPIGTQVMQDICYIDAKAHVFSHDLAGDAPSPPLRHWEMTCPFCDDYFMVASVRSPFYVRPTCPLCCRHLSLEDWTLVLPYPYVEE